MQYWDDLRYLLALDENGSLIKAAKQLRTNPTTVSRHIKRLSETYKKTLVTRQPNGEWQLTKEGGVFAETAKRCFLEINALNGESAKASPEITITTIDFVGDYILTPRISDMLSRPNGIDLTIDMRDRNMSLAFGEADLAVRLGRPTSGKLVASKLTDLDMNVFSFDGTGRKHWVGLPSQFDWVPEMQLGLEVFGCKPILRVGSFASMRGIALRHNLACIGPSLMMHGWNGLEPMSNSHAPAVREVWSVFHESRRHDEALMQARDWVKQCFADLPERAAA